MNALDTLAGVSLGFYILTVAVRGNVSEAIELANRDKSFLQWAIALAILMYLYDVPQLQGVASMLILCAFIGLGLIAGDNIIKSTKEFWSSLGA